MKTNYKMIQVFLATLVFLAASFSAYAAPNVVAWGDNQYGATDVPSDLTNAVAIAAGTYHNLALRSDGTVVAWGHNDYGQCNVPALPLVKAIAAASDFSLALKADGTVAAWGSPTRNVQNLPSGLTSVVAISAGPNSDGYCLALREDGSLIAWGASDRDRLNVPAGQFKAISSGGYFDLALRVDETVVGWAGASPPGMPWSGIPVPPDWINMVAIAAGSDHYLGLREDGTVVGVGSGVPENLSSVIAIAAGRWFNLALKADHTVVAWDTGTNILSTPSNLRDVYGVAVGYNHSLALILKDPPVIMRNPLSRTVAIGSTVSFGVQATGDPPLVYQWYFGTNEIAGATNRSLVLTNLRSSDSGDYRVLVSNPGGTAWSEPAMLSVLPMLDIHLVPRITLWCDVGSEYRLEYVNAVGPTDAWQILDSGTITNNPQWYFDVSAIGQPQRFYRVLQVP